MLPQTVIDKCVIGAQNLENRMLFFNRMFECFHINRPRGPMDKASAHGAGECRFESYRGHLCNCFNLHIFLLYEETQTRLQQFFCNLSWPVAQWIRHRPYRGQLYNCLNFEIHLGKGMGTSRSFLILYDRANKIEKSNRGGDSAVGSA